MKTKAPKNSVILAFHEAVSACLNLPLPEADCIGGRDWTIETPVGPVSVSVHHGETDSVYLRFLDRTEEGKARWREAGKGEVNPYSGKWNVHQFQHGPEVTVALLRQRLRKIGFEPGMPSSDTLSTLAE
jgi:hypothetical protein